MYFLEAGSRHKPATLVTKEELLNAWARFITPVTALGDRQATSAPFAPGSQTGTETEPEKPVKSVDG